VTSAREPAIDGCDMRARHPSITDNADMNFFTVFKILLTCTLARAAWISKRKLVTSALRQRNSEIIMQPSDAAGVAMLNFERRIFDMQFRPNQAGSARRNRPLSYFCCGQAGV